MLIIPAIDLYEQKVVRLRRGDFSEITYYDFLPLEIAKKFENFGFEWIHVVDLDASRKGTITSEKIIREIKESTSLKIEFGGGIRSSQDVKKLFSAGIDKVIIGSLSLDNKSEFEKIIRENGSEKLIVALDAEDEMIKTSGWTKKSGVMILDHISYCSGKGINTFLCTDISKDGMLEGPNIQLYKKIHENFPECYLIASGGIGSIKDIYDLIEIDIYGAVVGKSIYENKIKLEDLIKIGD